MKRHKFRKLLNIKVVKDAENKPLYGTWNLMLHRCFNTDNSKYKDYGGRGITVCNRWLDFLTFELDMSPRPTGYTIERIDVNGNYCPENCTWATLNQQSKNKRNNKLSMGLAKEIRLLKKEGVTRKKLSEKFNVSVASIKKVLSNSHWVET